MNMKDLCWTECHSVKIMRKQVLQLFSVCFPILIRLLWTLCSLVSVWVESLGGWGVSGASSRAHILCQQRHPSATLFRESAWQGRSWRQSSLASSVRIRLLDPPALASSHGFPLGPTPAPRRLLGEVLVVAAVFSSFSYPEVWAKTEDGAMCGGVRICEPASKPFWAWRWVTRSG